MTTPPGPWKAIVFDFDGTLARLNIDFPAMRTALWDLIADYRIPTEGIRHMYILEMIGAAGALLAAQRPKETAPFLHDAHALIAEIEIRAADEGTLFDGTKTLLTELARRSIRTGVITRNCRAAVFRIFPDIHSYCQCVLTREDQFPVKPNPDHLKAALTALGVAPTDAAMVGDHPIDIQTGRAAGAFTIGVLTGYSKREAFLDTQADMIVSDAGAILGILP